MECHTRSPMPILAPQLSGIPRGDNLGRSVIDLVRPHLHTGDCLIVTGYYDLLSSLSIIMDNLGPAFRDSSHLPRPRIRLAYGIDTASTTAFRGGRAVAEEVHRHFLGRRGLEVEDSADLKAVMAMGR